MHPVLFSWKHEHPYPMDIFCHFLFQSTLAMTIPDVSSSSNEPGWLLAMTIPDVSSSSNEPGWLLAMTIPDVRAR
jgi:hypothetical protein